MLQQAQEFAVRVWVSNRSRVWLVDALLLFIGISWGYTFVLTKYVIQTMPVFLFLGTRFFIAGIILAVILFVKGKVPPSRKDLRQGAIAGLLLSAAYSLQTFGMLHTTPGMAGMITELTTIMTPFFYFATTRIPVGKIATLATFIAFSGSFMMEWNGHGMHFHSGDWLVLLCDFAYAAHLLLVDRKVEELNVFSYIVVQLLTVGVACMTLGLFTETFPSHLSDFQWFAYIYELIFGTLLAYVVQIFAQKYTNPTHVVIILSVEGPFSLFFSWLQWGEHMTVFKGSGALLIFVAALLVEMFGMRGKDTMT